MDNLVVTDALLDEIEKLGPGDQALWIFLEQSEEFKGYWEVGGIYPEYFFDFEDIVGNYNLVSPITIAAFSDRVDELGYHVAFTEPPDSIMETYERLTVTPTVRLNSALEGTVNGFLPWQITGFNKLIKDETIKGGYVVWATGAGKTAFIASAIKHHMGDGSPFDLAFCIVKSHNKIDTQRKLKSLGDIDSVIIDGDWNTRRQKNKEVYIVPGPRQIMYEDINEKLDAGEQVIAIMNYEKLREDTDYLAALVQNRRVLFFWDEMPTKLSNREAQIYKATKRILYKSFYSKPRTKWMRHWALTATPIENSPEDVFNCVNLINPGTLGTIGQFQQAYVTGYNHFNGKPDRWNNLDRMDAKLTFMTHRVSKEDPQVKAMFPDVLDMETPIDWNPKHRAIYDKLTGKAKDLIMDLDDANILSLIQVMQMMCDAPSMIQQSAANRVKFLEALETAEQLSDLPSGPTGSDLALTLINALGLNVFTDTGHTKLDMMREIICEKHPNDKIVVHSTWAEYIFPIWEEHLTKWGVSYVVYHGTQKQRQAALDAFRNDPDIHVFISGDAGADSIDIAEAPVGINYNIPWKWTTLKQREGRRDRVNSLHELIYTYTLTMPNSVDERKWEICQRKYSYHQAIFDGKAADEMLTVGLTRNDLMYMLFGDD
jgi:hypothetical protein